GFVWARAPAMNRHLFDTPSADPIASRQRQISDVLHNAALTKLTNCERLCAESTGCFCCAVKRLRWSQSKCGDDSESAGTMVLPLATTGNHSIRFCLSDGSPLKCLLGIF